MDVFMCYCYATVDRSSVTSHQQNCYTVEGTRDMHIPRHNPVDMYRNLGQAEQRLFLCCQSESYSKRFSMSRNQQAENRKR
jgi:hypothetical protein